MISNEERYRQFLQGDEESLRALMEQYGDALTFYIDGYVHDLSDAEALMIDAFAYLVVKKPHIYDNGFQSYLYKSARHLALRYLQKQRSHPVFSFEDLDREPEGPALLETVMKTQERNRILRACMGQLPADYREALYLFYLEGLNYEETAAVIGVNRKRVDNLIQRGKKMLKPLLEKEGITDAYNG